MADTTFSSGTTITSGWLNDANTAVYKKIDDFYSAKQYGIISDGSTDQTAALVALFSTLSGQSFRGKLHIPYNTKFTVSTVYAAVYVGLTLEDDSSINWGQPPTYKNRFTVRFSGDSVSDDSQTVIASPHHPAVMLLNMGTAGSGAADSRYATILHAVGQDPAGDPLLGFIQQFAKDPSTSRWRTSFRLQTPYAVAINNPINWAQGQSITSGDYRLSDNGKVYAATSSGTTGATAPTGTGTGINDGGVTWDYSQAALNIDRTVLDFDEAGNFGTYGTGAVRWTQQGATNTHYIEQSGTTLTWRDSTRSRDNLSVSTTDGLQLAAPGSIKFTTLSGATPTQATPGCYISNGGATTMTNLVLPTGQTSGHAILMFANGNTTLQHGANFILKGAVNVTPTSGQLVELVKYSTHSSAWIEKSRNF